jgi:hypothetical protein
VNVGLAESQRLGQVVVKQWGGGGVGGHGAPFVTHESPP